MNRRSDRGFTYMALLILVAVWSISLCITVEVFEKKRQRELRTQLVWVAGQYTRAIESYYYSAPADKRKLPGRVEELLEDKRFYPPARHLRAQYTDATARDLELRLILTDRGMIGMKIFDHNEGLDKEYFSANFKE